MTSRKTLTLPKGNRQSNRTTGHVIGVGREENGNMTCTVEVEKKRDGTTWVRSIRFSREELNRVPEYTLYEMLAARMFKVYPNEVTKAQKEAAKKAYYQYLYGGWDK